MKNMAQIKNLKVGCGVNHPIHGYMLYRGLATINPYSDKVAIPHKYIFWLSINEYGHSPVDLVISNGNDYVEVVD